MAELEYHKRQEPYERATGARIVYYRAGNQAPKIKKDDWVNRRLKIPLVNCRYVKPTWTPLPEVLNETFTNSVLKEVIKCRF